MSNSNFDFTEVSKFSQRAAHWWEADGELKALHDINPLRVNYINQRAPLAGKHVIDIGCGGGILSESMAALGAIVTGIDMSEEALAVAKLHQHESKLSIHYELSTAENMAEKHPQQFDIVTCLEMLEHVPDPASVIRSAATLVKPDGDVFFSTLNRNLKSYLFGIIGAEYLLKLLPKNTHDFAKFIRPSELDEWARASKLKIIDMIGMGYNPFTKKYFLTSDTSVNYFVHAKKI